MLNFAEQMGSRAVMIVWSLTLNKLFVSLEMGYTTTEYSTST